MKLYPMLSFIKSFRDAINANGERETVKVGVKSPELTDREKVARSHNEAKVMAAVTYLSRRGRLALTCPDFEYVPAVSTDVRVTMRNYVVETMPEAADTYKFLFDLK